jgi:hypothetical protein
MKVNFIRKATNYELMLQDKFVIEKVVTVKPRLFDSFINKPLDDYKFIDEHKDLMRIYVKGIYHCIFVTSEEHDFGILVQSDGYGYARFSAYQPKVLLGNESVPFFFENGTYRSYEMSLKSLKIDIIKIKE